MRSFGPRLAHSPAPFALRYMDAMDAGDSRELLPPRDASCRAIAAARTNWSSRWRGLGTEFAEDGAITDHDGRKVSAGAPRKAAANSLGNRGGARECACRR